MEFVEAMEVEQEYDVDYPISPNNPAAQVFAIPGLTSQIISQCNFLSSTASLLQLRLISRDLDDAVLDLKVTPCDLPMPRLSINKMTTSDSDNADSRRFDEMWITSMDSRMCRIVVAELTTDTFRQNLLAVIRAHGNAVQELQLSRVPEESLVSVMCAVSNRCPNLQNLEVTIVLECSGHEGEVPIADRFAPFIPHLALTKISLKRIQLVGYDAGKSTVCNRATDVLAAVVAGAPNLETLHVGGEGFLRLELARNPRLKTLSIVLGDVQERHQMQEIWDMVASRSVTLTDLTIDFVRVGEPEGAWTYDVPALVANPSTFVKLKKFKFASDCNITEGLSSAFVQTILGGGAPVLEDLRMELGEVKDSWDNPLAEMYRYGRPVESCRVLELSSFSFLREVGPFLAQLTDFFPNLMNLALVTELNHHRGLDLDPDLHAAFLPLMRWDQLKQLKWTMEEPLSIRQLAQLLAMLGQGFFVTRGLRNFELRTNRFSKGCDLGPTDMRELERTFGLLELEDFLVCLLWMRDMEAVKFDKIVMPRGGGIRVRLLGFIEDNQLSITFSNEGG